jgi:outer membrane protein assembly factor BamB
MPIRSVWFGSALALALLFLASVPAIAAGTAAGTASPDWPQFRGPDRDGTVAAAGRGGPVELWRRPIGSGFSSVAVRGGLVYTMEAVDDEEAVLALDAATGETRWRTVVGVPMESEFGRGPRATPTLAGDRLFTVSSQANLVSLDAATGEIRWQKDLTAFGPPPRFGYASSPLVLEGSSGGLVVVDVGTKDLMDAARAEAEAEAEARSAAKKDDPETEIAVPPRVGAIAGFDARTGEMVWRGGFPGGAGYTAPIVLTLDGVPQMVFVRRDSAVGVGLDGKALWTFPTEPTAAIAMPVQLADDVFFMSTSDDHFGGKAIRVARAEDGGWTAEEAWWERLMRNHFNTSIALGGVLFGFDNTTFKALDAATGKRLWAHRGFGKGSLLAAGDLLYVLGDTGELALVHATGEGYRETGRVQAMTGKAWTSPSLANGRVYLRDHDEIVAYDVRASAIAEAGASGERKGELSVAGDLSAGELEAKRKAAESAATLSPEKLLEHFLIARRGDRWQGIRSLEMTGTYHAFSETSDFVLRRARAASAGGQDLFYLRYTVFEAPAVRAVDAEGPWLQHKFLSPEPVRTIANPEVAAYTPQMLREAVFAPMLLRAGVAGRTLQTAGTSEINGRPTVDLKVTFPAEGEGPRDVEAPVEIWHLDPETFLEVAVDSQIVDYTQSGEPLRQRAYFSDFREVEGAMIPFRVELEFNARFEGMTVESVTVNPELDASAFSPPEVPAAESSEPSESR